MDCFHRNLKHIEQIDLIIDILETIQLFETNLNELKQSINTKKYSKCYELLSSLNKLINESDLFSQNNAINNVNNSKTNVEENDVDKEKILKIKELKENFVVQRERLWYDLGDEWNRMISIEPSSTAFAAAATTTTAPLFSIDSACIKIDTNITQHMLDNLTRFSSLNLNLNNNSNSNNISTEDAAALIRSHSLNNLDINSFIFNSKLKLFSKCFLRFCKETIVSSEFNSGDDDQANGDNLLMHHDVHVENDSDSKIVLRFKRKEKSRVQSSTKSKSMIKDEKKLISNQFSDPISRLRFKLSQMQTVLQFIYENFFKYNVFLLTTTNTAGGVESGRQPKSVCQ